MLQQQKVDKNIWRFFFFFLVHNMSIGIHWVWKINYSILFSWCEYFKVNIESVGILLHFSFMFDQLPLCLHLLFYDFWIALSICTCIISTGNSTTISHNFFIHHYWYFFCLTLIPRAKNFSLFHFFFFFNLAMFIIFYSWIVQTFLLFLCFIIFLEHTYIHIDSCEIIRNNNIHCWYGFNYYFSLFFFF